MNNIVVWAADVGSIKANKFGWCRGKLNMSFNSGTDITVFAEGIADDISTGMRVALGYECPLFVPITDNPFQLTSSRLGEGNRPWSAAAGCGALATGLTECVWVLEKIRRLSRVTIHPTLSWGKFEMGQANLFIWEAFVTAGAKSSTDMGDAEIAVATFCNKYPNITTDVIAENPYSLVGAALLRSGLIVDIRVLFEPCIVLKS